MRTSGKWHRAEKWTRFCAPNDEHVREEATGLEPLRPRGMRRTVVAAQDRLVEVDDRPGHQPGLRTDQECYGARDFRRVDEALEGLSLRCLFQPPIAGAMVGPHDPVFARRARPA